MEMIGGGRIMKVRVVRNREVVMVPARMGLFKTGIGVFLDPSRQGMLAIPHWEDLIDLIRPGQSPRNFRWQPEMLRYEVVRDIYHALRQTARILFQYYGRDFENGERARIRQAVEQALELNLQALGLRKGQEENYEEELERRVRHLTLLVGRVRNLTKAEAMVQVASLKTVFDSRGRVSETVKRTKALAAARRFEARLYEIACIGPHIVAREQALLILKSLVEYKLKATRFFIGEILFQSFEEVDSLTRERASDRLLFLSQALATIDVRPYMVNCRRIVQELNRARELLAAGEFAKVKKLLTMSGESLKLKELQNELEKLIFDITLFLLSEEEMAMEQVFPYVRRIEYLVSRLSQIDERYFRQPVCQEVMGKLEEAGQLLGNFNPRDLQKAREKLKAASAIM